MFKIGVMAEAIQTHSWVVLDELNLALTNVTRVQIIWETDPPDKHWGRKVLSRAFRNKFIKQLPASEQSWRPSWRRGYLVLAVRVRNIEENKVIFDILKKVQQHSHTLPSHSAWTFDMSMSRLGVLLCQAWSHKEPVMQAGVGRLGTARLL